MNLRTLVLRYRDTSHGPEAVIEVAVDGGGAGVFFVQHSIQANETMLCRILTFLTLGDAIACFSGYEHPPPLFQKDVTDESLFELVKRSIGDPAGKPPGEMVEEPSTGIVGECYYQTVLHIVLEA
ncbi:MAG TPA: hypothetical protein DCS23_00790 [Candidatus Yonathbacteria bacterium]|nr:hypothetical protein [Candidatus Yonathbacteria bacterium]